MATAQHTTANSDIRWRCARRVKELTTKELLVLYCSRETVTLDVRDDAEDEWGANNHEWIVGRRRTIDAVGGNVARITDDCPYVDIDARTLIAPRASPITPNGWHGVLGMVQSNVLAPLLANWWRQGRFVVTHDHGLLQETPAPSRLLDVVQRDGGQAIVLVRRVAATPALVHLALKNLEYVYQPDELAVCDRSALNLLVWKQLATGCDVFRVEVRVSSEQLWIALTDTTRAISWEQANGPSRVERRLSKIVCASAEHLRQFPLLFTQGELLDTMVALLRR